jgi:hypothetical protein
MNAIGFLISLVKCLGLWKHIYFQRYFFYWLGSVGIDADDWVLGTHFACRVIHYF